LKTKVAILLLCVALLASFCQFTKPVQSGSGTVLKITPERNIFAINVTEPGAKFVVNLTVIDATDLFAWQFGLQYNNSLINFTQLILPPDHVFAGKSFLETPLITEPGTIYYGITLGPGQKGVNVTKGTLCQLEFEILDPSFTGVKLPALCILQFIDSDYTFLLDSKGAVIESTWKDSIFAYTYLRSNIVTVDGHVFNIVTCSNGEVVPSSFKVLEGETAIEFNITGPSGFGFVNVTIPKALLNGNPSAWTVYVNGVTTNAQISSNATYTSVYVEFTFGSQVTIRIEGTWIIPELATMLIPTIFAVTAIKAIIKLRKRKS